MRLAVEAEEERIEQEEVFRRERERREAAEMEALAALLQCRVRGAGTRRKVEAMRFVGAALGALKRLRTRRAAAAALALVARRWGAATAIQAAKRRRGGFLRAAGARLARCELVEALLEEEFAGFYPLLRRAGSGLEEEEEEEGGERKRGVGGGPEVAEAADMARRWRRVLPDNASPPEGCELFRDGISESWKGTLKLEFGD